MTKIAYNGCFGGFSLSRTAVLLGRKLSGNPNWGGVTVKGDIYEDGQICERDYGQLNDIPRTDPTLITVIEKLGRKADGDCANLQIEDIPAGVKYRIDEYDGNERVMTQDSYDWETA